MNFIKEMLLIEELSVLRLYKEINIIAGYMLAPLFTIAIILEYFGEMKFFDVVRRLFIISIFMSCFYQIHSKGSMIALESSSELLHKVSPRNIFIKKWYQPKIKTNKNKNWGLIESMTIPNINDAIATAFFVLSKIFIWLLKLIYSSVYHLSYVFSGITALLYFFGWSNDALKGTVQASLWCILMPFVVVAILALVGNSIDEKAIKGFSLFGQVNTIIWLFGITLLLSSSPFITYGLIKGEGMHSFGAKMGTMVVSSGIKALKIIPMAVAMKGIVASRLTSGARGLNRIGKGSSEKFSLGGFNKHSQGAGPSTGLSSSKAGSKRIQKSTSMKKLQSEEPARQRPSKVSANALKQGQNKLETGRQTTASIKENTLQQRNFSQNSNDVMKTRSSKPNNIRKKVKLKAATKKRMTPRRKPNELQ